MLLDLILGTFIANKIVVPTIVCPPQNPVEECLAEKGYGNYEVMGPFDREDGELVYVGYLDQFNQINIVTE